MGTLALGGLGSFRDAKFVEKFNREGPLHGSRGWVDFASINPDNFLPVYCFNGSAGCLTAVPAVGPEGDISVNAYTGHSVFGREMGSLNGEIKMEIALLNGWHFAHQLSPAFGLKLDLDCDVREVGVTFNYDVGLPTPGSAYPQNVFNQELPLTFNTYTDQNRGYRVVGDDITKNYSQGLGQFVEYGIGEQIGVSGLTNRGAWSSATAYVAGDVVTRTWIGQTYTYICKLANTNQTPPIPPTVSGGPFYHAYWKATTGRFSSASSSSGPFPAGSPRPYPTTATWTMRVVDNWFQVWMDGVKLHDPCPVPSWAQGRDGWGLHCVNISWKPGSEPFVPGYYAPPLDGTLFRLNKWIWRPYNTPLV